MNLDWKIPLRGYRSNKLVSVSPEMPLDELERLLSARDITAVPVLEGGVLVGIVSTTDLVRAQVAESSATLACHVMRRSVVTVDDDGTLRDAAEKMVAHRIHRLVVTRDGAPVGVISTRDAMRAVLAYRVERPLAGFVTSPVETVDVGDPIELALTRLAAANVHGLVVVDGDRPVGVFTHREALRAHALPPDLRKTPVEDVMSYETICLNVSTPLYRVAGHAISMNVRRILAVSNRQLMGIVTGFDLVRFMTEDDTASAQPITAP